MHKPTRFVVSVIIATGTLTGSVGAQTWTGNSLSGPAWNASLLGSYQNWSGGTLPGAGSVVTFGSGFLSGNPNLNGSRTVSAMIVNAPLPFTIVGGAGDTFTLSSGTISRTPGATGDHTIATRVHFGNNAALSVEGVPSLGRLILSNTVSGTGNLTKSGPGTLVLSGDNTYPGGTSVLAGRLVVGNGTGSGTGPGAVSVAANAILAGNGRIGGSTEIAGAGVLEPGNPVGTLTFNNSVELQDGAKLNIEMNAVLCDRLRITQGTFTIRGKVDLLVSSTGSPPAGTYTLIDWTGATASGVDLADFVLRAGSIHGQLAISGSTLQFTVPPVIYVKAGATGANNGTSWTDAYTSLQSALAAATAGTQIWVAAGTYYPTAAADPVATFQLKNDVVVYGGFAGTPGQEGIFSVRSYAANATLLSGEIPGSNSRHVVTGTGTNATAVLDGFTIRDALGNNDVSMGQFGGGLYSNPGSPTIVNCVFRNNNSWWGGAVANVGGSQPRFVNCAFFANSGSSYGGAVYNQQSAPAFHSCTFTGNTAGQGGGAFYNNVGSPLIANCILWGNSGVQIANVNASVPVVRYSCIAGGWSGTANSAADPLFVNAAAYDLRLQPTSPCIGAGNNSDIPPDDSDADGDFDKTEPVPLDLAGLPRVVVGVVDMGAYEHQAPAIPHRPLGVVASPVDAGSIQLDWNDNADTDLAGYNVYRSTTPLGAPAPSDLIVSLVGQSSFLDSGVDSSLTCYYWVTAVDADSNESTASLRVQASPLPTAPGALTATSVSSTHVNLDWADNPQTDLASYKIYRGVTSSFAVEPASLVATVSTSTWLDSGRTAGVTCYYRVTAVDQANGESLPSEEVSATPLDQATIIYVNATLPEGGSGTSWTDAFKQLRTALEVAESGDQIWAAVGTYKPGAARTSAFALKNGVAIYGGFAGTESSPDQRPADPDPFTIDPATDSVLSGDVGQLGSAGDNVYHVVTGHGTNATAVLDGFTLAYGRASGAPNPNFENIGGGIYVSNGGPTVRRCNFIDNSALVGSGICTIGGTSMTISNCAFVANYTLGGGNSGAGLYAQGASHTLVNCVFLRNTAGTGGGIYNSGGAHTTAINCLFIGNSASFRGGAVATGSLASSQTTLINCTLTGNAAGDGSAVTTGDVGGVPCQSTLVNCIVWGNSGTQIFNSPSAANVTAVTHSCIEGGYAGAGNIGSDPLFVDADGPDDQYGTADDNARLQAGSPCVNNGSNAAVPTGVRKDLDAQFRFAGCLVDMGAYELPGAPGISVPGDFDDDCDVDGQDLAEFTSCAGGPAVPLAPACADRDLDQDADADQDDFAIIQRCWTGPDRLGSLECLFGPSS